MATRANPNEQTKPSPFGTFLRQLRVEKGLSLQDVEDRCGIDKSNISKYELSVIVPDPENVKRLAAALGIQAATLFEKL
jgi:transcriptional regulator with XRE-family HTH domain